MFQKQAFLLWLCPEAVRRKRSAAAPQLNLNYCGKIKKDVDKAVCLWYYVFVAYDGNEKHKACGSGGTADALASGASGGDPVEVQILSTAPFKSLV